MPVTSNLLLIFIKNVVSHFFHICHHFPQTNIVTVKALLRRPLSQNICKYENRITFLSCCGSKSKIFPLLSN